MSEGARRERLVAIVPVRGIADAKSRLSPALADHERAALVTGMLQRTIRAATACPEIDDVVVISPDPIALRIGAAAGAIPMLQRGVGENEAVVEARAAVTSASLPELAGPGGMREPATAILVLPIDLAAVSAAELTRVIGAAHDLSPVRSPLVALVADRHGTGTNLLLVSPPGLVEPVFGLHSRSLHLEAARQAGVAPIEIPSPLALDLDTPEDLSVAGLALDDLRAASFRIPEPDETDRIELLALEGIPEVRPGDDLAALIGDALARTPGALPLRSGDVLVVTQKVVSKAEGAIVDLETVEPRPEAVEIARRWDRDARQVEVVLRESVRVVRSERGILITETPHGFVLANSGVDASNTGPGGGRYLTLLPRDPDASARAIRAAVRERFGLEIAVVITDSFGRPWRLGITDVAIGVSGLLPLEDLRGTPDADGRVMRATVRAVADEIASAAELVLGKTARRPVALVRGLRIARGDGSIRDLVMPRDMDLFP